MQSVFARTLFDRLLPIIGAAAALGLLVTLLLIRPAWAQDGTPEQPERTYLLVQREDGSQLVRAVTYTVPISGLAVLQASGLELAVAESSFGPAVCAIAGTGCPAEDCFCNPDNFWNYGFSNGETWESYAVGAADSLIAAPDTVEMWRWGAFTGTVGVAASTPAITLRALDWLLSQQSPVNGGYGSMGGAVETMFAIGANGLDAAEWRIAGGRRDLRTFARLNQTRYTRTDVAAAGKVAVALAASDGCYTANALQPSDYYSATLGAYSPESGFNAWGILGTLALSETVPGPALESLRAAITVEGGWEWQAGFGPDSNTTALAVQALIAAGEPVTSTAVSNGLAFLKEAQQPDGGFAYDLAAQFGSDANSTAYAVQAISAAAQYAGSEEWSVEGVSALDYLASLQLEDGSFEWQAGGGANLFAAQQAIPALLNRAYPIAVQPVGRCTR